MSAVMAPPAAADEAQWLARFERTLAEQLARNSPADADSQPFCAALRYACQGGKRLRALMAYASGDALRLAPAKLDAVAVAIELIHAYSLVHDDLPAMDNDDLRRGLPTVHKAYGESTAILVGDTLNTLAFGVLASAESLSAETRLSLVTTLAAAAGAQGMIGGQVLDLTAQQSANTLSLAQLTTLHRRKTGALIEACFSMAGIAAGASAAHQQALADCGRALGLAYQVQDDVLDVATPTAELGKTAGKDARDGKQTFVSLLGLDAARRHAEKAFDAAEAAAATLPQPAALLRLIQTIRRRRH